MNSSVGTVIPSTVNYAKQKPQAVTSFSRRVKSLATNAQTFGENQYANIILDTSVPGSNLDPGTSYLKWDMTITNTNPFIDYVSFGPCGVASLFEEFRIICQGNPVEEILNYPIVYEAFQDISGHCKEPYSMYRSCRINQKVDEKFEVNAIKPPMVSQSGNPMFYGAVFGMNNNKSSTWITSTTTTLNNKPYLLGTQAAGVSFHKFIVTGGAQGYGTNAEKVQLNNQRVLNLQASAPSRPEFPQGDSPNLFGFVPYLNAEDDTGQNNQPAIPFDLPSILLGRCTNNVTGPMTGYLTQTGAFWSMGSGNIANGTIPTTNTSNVPNPNRTNCFGATLGTPGDYTTTDLFAPSFTFDYTDGQLNQINGAPPATSLFGSTTYFFKNGDTDPYNPLNWPFVMPNDYYTGYETKPPVNSIQDQFMSLFNVKNIPIGIQGNPRGSTTTKGLSTYTSIPAGSCTSSLNFTNVDKLTTPSRTIKLTVELPLLSGLLGSMAAKMFPTMLGSPGNTYLQVKTAQASRALQVSMDPCRRVLGTVRDFVPFGGTINGKYGQFSYLNPAGDTGASDAINTKTANAFVNSLTSNLNYYPSTVGISSGTTGTPQLVTFTPTISNSYFGIGSGAIMTSGYTGNLSDTNINVTDKPLIGGCFAAIGANLLPFQTWLSQSNGSGASAAYDIIFSPYSTAAMEGKWTTYDKINERTVGQSLNTIPTWQVKGPQINYGSTTVAGVSAFPNTGSLVMPTHTQSTAITQSTYASMNMAEPGLLTDNGGFGYAASLVTSTVNGTVGPLAANQMMPSWSQGILSGYTIATTSTPTVAATKPILFSINSINSPNLISEFGGYIQIVGYPPIPNDTTQPVVYPTDLGDPWMTSQGVVDPVTGSSIGISMANTGHKGFSPTTTFCGVSGRNITLNVNPYGMIAAQNNSTSTVQPTSLQFLQTNNTYTTNNANWATPGNISNLMEIDVVGRPSGVPMPQYMLVSTPWSKKALYTAFITSSNPNYYAIFGEDIAASDLCSETYACYGTYLPASVAQSQRCFNQYGGSTNYVQYSISNLEFISQQVILPEQTNLDILQQAATAEGISISTTSVRVYQSTVNSASTQSIIIPAKIASANALYVVFLAQNQLSTTEGQLYNSQSRFCPYSQIYSIDSNPQTSATQSTSILNKATSGGLYAIGQQTPFGITNAPSASGSFQIQLVSGNEYIPTQPITCISEIIAELCKCNHSLFDVSANTNFDFLITEKSGYTPSLANLSTNVYSYADTNVSSQFYYDCLQERGFCSAFTFPGYLDDQTYISNPNWNVIGAATWNANISSYGNGQQGTYGATNNLYGARGDYVLPKFIPIESTFMLGFDLDSWSGFTDLARSGTFLGNNVLTLRITDAPGLDYAQTAKKTGIVGLNMYSIVPHDLRISFQAGGSIQPYY